MIQEGWFFLRSQLFLISFDFVCLFVTPVLVYIKVKSEVSGHKDFTWESELIFETKIYSTQFFS